MLIVCKRSRIGPGQTYPKGNQRVAARLADQARQAAFAYRTQFENVMIAPPLIITREEIRELLERLDRALARTQAAL